MIIYIYIKQVGAAHGYIYIWNSLPSELKLPVSPSVFKKRLTQHVISLRCYVYIYIYIYIYIYDHGFSGFPGIFSHGNLEKKVGGGGGGREGRGGGGRGGREEKCFLVNA